MKKKVEEIEKAVPLDIDPLNPNETIDYFNKNADKNFTEI